MALNTYSSLQTAVATWLGRPGDTFITSNAPDWVDLAEERIAYGGGMPGEPTFTPPLRIRKMEEWAVVPLQAATDGGTSGGTANAQTLDITPDVTLATGLILTFTVGAGLTNTGAATMNVDSGGAVAIVKDRDVQALEAGDLIAGASYSIYYHATFASDSTARWVLMPEPGMPLPANYLGARSFYIPTDPKQDIEYLTPENFHLKWAGSSVGRPKAYTIEGDIIHFGPRPDTTYYPRLNFYRKFLALSDTQTDNWLLLNAPRIYLFAVLTEAEMFFGHPELAAMWASRCREAMAALQSANDDDRFGGGALVMRVDGSTP